MGSPDLRKRTLIWPRSGRARRARALIRLCVLSLLSYWLASVTLGSDQSARTVVWGRVADEIVEATRLNRDQLPEVEGQPPSIVTIIAAATRSQASTYRRTNESSHFIELLTSLRGASLNCGKALTPAEIDPPARPDVWQTFTRNASAQIDGVICSLRIDGIDALTFDGAYHVPWAWDLVSSPPSEGSGSALLLHCPLPAIALRQLRLTSTTRTLAGLSERANVTVSLQLHGISQPFALPTIALRAYLPPLPTEIGLVVAPLFGSFIEHDVVEWAVHHRALGLGPIHWYARDRRFGSWMDSWRDTDGASSDTFRYAPPLDPATFGTSKLAVEGLYQDQVLYALDAILRSTYLAPSRWLAFLDVDELALPDPMPRSPGDRRKAIIRFLDGFDADVPSISLGRTHSATNSHLGHLVDHRPGEITPAPRLSELGLIRSPQRSDWPGNHKHFHRVSAVASTSVHAVAELYPGFTYRAPIVPAELRIVHLGRSDFDEGPYEEFVNSPAQRAFEDEVWSRKDAALKQLHASGISRWLPHLRLQRHLF